MSDETEKVYHKLEEVISVCWELKDRITLKINSTFWNNFHLWIYSEFLAGVNYYVKNDKLGG